MRLFAAFAATICCTASLHAQETAPAVAPETAPAPEVVAPTIATHELRWRPNVGETRVMRLVAEQKVSAGSNQQLTQKVEMDYALQVLALGEDGSFTASNTFRAVRFNRIAPGIKQSFDSARPGKNLSDELKAYQAMAGAKITLRFSDRGALLEVVDAEQFYRRILVAMGMKPEDIAAMGNLVKTAATDQSFRNIGNTIASFPLETLKIGQTWSKRDAVMSNDNLIYDGICTLQSVAENSARIAIKSQIKPDASKPQTPTARAAALRGTQTGHYDIELDSGWTKSALLVQTIKAKLLANGQMVGPDSKAKGTSFNLSSTFTLRTLGVKRAP